MSNEPTPGKWVTVADSQFGTNCTKIMSGNAIVCICYGSNHENDARLIAAAPDLILALQDICKWIDRYIAPGHNVTTVARRAIAKATGETP